ncbi:MAG: phage major capsid protein [Candidatus Cellulosilyticum pullistercoris]|uniref:Phage major capsid protein n=1 Tax=Candidatus Cellulosilyticum pullistercoris TaxID=2838521 RepID=A0A9E2KCA0_9FIRM|nr:phage major capsid protein [Candidatus Cellulosilyticum pullistercoris]
MTKEEYKNKRKEMINRAEQLMNENKCTEASSLINEIESLDAAYSEEQAQRERRLKNKYSGMTFKDKAEYEALKSQLVNEGRYDEIDLLDEAFHIYATNRTNEQALNGTFGKNTNLPIYGEGDRVNMNGSKPVNNRKEGGKMNIFLNKGEKLVNRINVTEESQVLNQDGALGEVVRGMVTGKWSSNEFKNAVTTTATGVLIPEVLSSKIIDKARELSLFTNAGVPIIPMESNNVHISRVKTDPTFKFKKEGEAATESSFELEDVNLQSKTAYGYAYVTLEAIKSSQNLDAILKTVFAEAMAQAIDDGMLYGQYNSSTTSYETFAPSGIMNDANINSIAATAGAGYDDIIKAIGKVRGGNGIPTVLGINSNTEEIFSLLKTLDGQYLAAPKAVSEMQTIVSNQLKHDDSAGDDALVFDPNAMIIGIQNNIQIKIIEDSECLKKGLVGFQIYAMLDCKAIQPKHICKITGIKEDSN